MAGPFRVTPTLQQPTLPLDFSPVPQQRQPKQRRRTPKPKPAARYERESETSRQAAAAIEGNPSAAQRGQVYTCIESQGRHGATQEEISKATAIVGDSVRPRLRELLEAGRIWKDDTPGSVLVRPTQKGRSAAIWYTRYIPVHMALKERKP